MLREDAANCLLGTFGVNLPVIYGKGTDSSLHLEEAIAQDKERSLVKRDYQSFHPSPSDVAELGHTYRNAETDATAGYKCNS